MIKKWVKGSVSIRDRALPFVTLSQAVHDIENLRIIR